MVGESRPHEAGDHERGAAGNGSESPASRAGREQLLDAFAKVAAERGYAQTTVDEVAAAAGLPSAAFYTHFSDKRQCLNFAHAAFFERLWDEAASAVDAQQEWALRVRDAVVAALEFVAETASRARFFTVETMVVGPAIIERHFSALDRVVPVLREGREHFPEASGMPELTEAMLVGGAALLLYRSLLAEEQLGSSRLAAELVEFLLAPYVGHDEARRIAA